MRLAFITFITWMAAAALHSESPEARDWLTAAAEIPKEVADERSKLEDDRFYECRITRLGTAIDRLKDTTFIELTDDLAAYYAGHSYKPRKGNKAYLVRGAFSNYTGKFSLYFHNGVLLVEHMSLGRSFTAEFCPLIVQLPNPPKKVFIQIGGAQ